MIKFRDAVEADIKALLTLDLRTEDRRELEAMSGMGSNLALLSTCYSSLWVKVALDSEGIVTVFGLTEQGNPWMVGTDRMWKYPMTVMKAGKKYIQECLDEFGGLWNYVDYRNTRHILWLMKMGFTFTGETKEFSGVDFLYFYMRR